MSLNRYSNNNVEAVSAENDRDRDRDCDHSCDSESARALKRILSLLDDLNNNDLRILDDVIDRLECSRHRS
ncbi:hypothetical protein [Caproiciproducens faecalis]|uniref:Uncharacterized protein n=1 Tax=Caproiciproducens faecalis TaxID=2820301 RepID=A0ABS7DN50_9FIRM|nr:hypothetical protein [Caproiciproducens faecalis]MBW7572526.1 hypothetical protein [Caproiciproducens faecalis]